MKHKLLKKIIIFEILLFIISTNIIQASPNYNDLNENYLQLNNNNILTNDQNITILMNKLYMTSLSAGIIVNNSLFWNKGYGFYRNYYNILVPENSKTPTKDTIYIAASVSKTVTATAILQLYEKGKLNLTDNVNDYLGFNLKSPFYPNINITIQMLLNHTSGLNSSKSIYTISIIRNFMKNQNFFFKFLLTSKLKTLRNLYWLKNFQPGKDFSYANMDFALLDYIVEIVTGTSFEKYCKENIFDPLDMKNSGFNYRDFKINQISSPYLWLHKHKFYMKSYTYNFPLTGAGGLRTTVEDLSHFLIAHMNNGSYKNVRILNNSTVELMHNISAVTAGRLYYGFGLGWLIYNDTNFSGHDGDLLGGHARMKWNMPGNFGIIYFWNSDEHPGNFYDRLVILKDLEKELLKNLQNL
ncbi:hypothetical protein AYK20_01925 [Thermoplasmatales archaeon SG8-52-1]|nr:MAG: hypothetical protein AYK20_01925 [Thermoplasmatales archaeon SG8-52-1]